MPLDKNSLASSLKNLFEGKPAYPADAAEAAQKWASAYRQYAAAALAGPTAPVAAALAGAETTLAGALQAGFTAAAAAGPGGAAAIASAMNLAFVAFWLTPPVAFAPPAPAPPNIAGVVTLAPPGTLAGLLSAAFASGSVAGATAASQANAIAGALDTWTRTVLVVNTPVTPPGPPAPPAPLT